MTLIETGLKDAEVARRLAVPRATIGYWRRGRESHIEGSRCPRCWLPARRLIRLPDSDYAELLGLYLGDGCLSQAGRTTRLRIAMDARYPDIGQSSRRLLERCFPQNRVGTVNADQGSTVVLSVYSTHLPCVFPQHGSGKKHERRIVLEPWQRRCVERAPWAFLRGCIWSDGCSFVNKTGPYDYLTYDFRNSSEDIRGLFVGACHLVGVECRPTTERVRINRRSSVARMLENVGRKS